MEKYTGWLVEIGIGVSSTLSLFSIYTGILLLSTGIKTLITLNTLILSNIQLLKSSIHIQSHSVVDSGTTRDSREIKSPETDTNPKLIRTI
jgi:hypothetical protein